MMAKVRFGWVIIFEVGGTISLFSSISGMLVVFSSDDLLFLYFSFIFCSSIGFEI
jgi:hypothetical protein